MVTVTDESGKQSVAMDTTTSSAISTNPCERQARFPSPHSELHSTAVPPPHVDSAKSAHHNFRSMADLIRSQSSGNCDDVTSRDLIPGRDLVAAKSDENENSVQDLRLNSGNNGNKHRNLDSSMGMREEHLRLWCSGDLGNGKGAESNFMVDVDGQSSHSGIPSDFSSDVDHSELNNTQDEFDEKIEEDAEEKQNGEEGSAFKALSPDDEIDSLSDTEGDIRKSKRKQYTPKQRDSVRSPSSEEKPSKMRKLNDSVEIQKRLSFMQKQLIEMQSKLGFAFPLNAEAAIGRSFPAWFQNGVEFNSDVHRKNMHSTNHTNPLLSPIGVHIGSNRSPESKQNSHKDNNNTSPIQGDAPKDLEELARILKTEISSEVGTMVDKVVAKYAETRKRLLDSSPKEKPITSTPSIPTRDMARTHVSAVSCAQTPTHERPALNLSPRVMPEQLHRPQPSHSSSFLENIKNLPFPFNKPKQESVDKMQNMDNKLELPKPQKPMKFDEKHRMPFFDPARAFSSYPRPWFPHLPFFHHAAQVPTHPLHHAFGAAATHLKDQEQTEALPLVVNSPKKKRTKVTDTRLSPRAARALLQEPVPAEQPFGMHHPPNMSPLGMLPVSERKDNHLPPNSFPTPLIPASLPTSVAIPNPSLQHSELFVGFYGGAKLNATENMFSRAAHLAELSGYTQNGTNRSPPVRDDSQSPIYTPSNSPSLFRDSSSYGGDQDTCGIDGLPLTSTLTPMHLRKAKLMFFFVRYPSSSILKAYFPDVRFNKNNTAQLVKWFSNFREFYYIQMEKYARQAIAEGVKSPEDITVTTECEIYRVLNLHYNRNNQLEVPEGFHVTVQATLREFYKAIGLNKDAEQSWKKPIYKIIARMDESVPEYFKSANWMEQLNDL